MVPSAMRIRVSQDSANVWLSAELGNDPPRARLLQADDHPSRVLRLLAPADEEGVRPREPHRRGAPVDANVLDVERDLLRLDLLEALAQPRLFRRRQRRTDGAEERDVLLLDGGRVGRERAAD